jgi:uncharacterized protein
MKNARTGRRIAVGGLALAGVLMVGTAAEAAGVRFSDSTPLTASSGPTADEASPITFGNAAFRQASIADRTTQLADGQPNSGSWDMITVNETGRNRGRYLFTPFETAQAGVQRQDLRTGETETIWYAANPGDQVAFDASYWTPWGTYITAEESWGAGSKYGRLYELTNPLTADGVTEAGGEAAQLEHRNVIPRVSHEGVQFDDAGNMYFIDELNGGGIYKYVPADEDDDHRSGRGHHDDDHDGYFDAGQTFVLRVGDGTTPNATGGYTWVAITDEVGAPLPESVVVTDSNGVTSVDGRASADVAALKGTDYQRPEDLQIQTVRGRQRLYVTTTTTNEVYVLDLKAKNISVFANTSSVDLATGAAVGGTAFTNPDNLAVDGDGNIYVVEDRPGAVDDDIWLATDRNKDGDLSDPGEGLARWASNGTPGSEFTGLYFDPTDKRRAWVNIQHPTSGVDRTIEITINGRR